MSKATIRIPTPLRGFAGGADELELEGGTVGDLLRAAGDAHPQLVERILRDGQVRPFVNLFLGAKNIKTLGGLGAEVAEGDVLSVVPAVAGGRA